VGIDKKNLAARYAKMALRAANAPFMAFGRLTRDRVRALVAEQAVPVIPVQTKHGEIVFYSPSSLCAWRAHHLLSKEPDTLEWIDGFQAEDTLWDIGANVGSYTLSADRKGNRVMAFEPSAANYFILAKNVELNGLSDMVSAYCLAIDSETRRGSLNMTSCEAGGAISCFAEEKMESVAIGAHNSPTVSRQAMLGFSLDEFMELFHPPFPNHIKIDVDSIEDRIMEGGRKTMSDPRMRSLLIEIDENDQEFTQRVLALCSQAGLAIQSKSQLVPDSEEAAASGKSSIRNYIFVRPD
jgi:FkbM family methyltransferase